MDLPDALQWLEDHSSAQTLADMGPRYGIETPRAFGVSMAEMKKLAKLLGHDHGLAAQLWGSGWYEARMVAAMVDVDSDVTPKQMDRWCADFDNWAICDTVCFNLFDRTPHAWSKVDEWAGAPEEFRARGAFALLWSLALHDKESPDDRFVHGLELVEREVHDSRPYVNKALLMAMRAIKRRNPKLASATKKSARRLAGDDDPLAQRLGTRALKL